MRVCVRCSGRFETKADFKGHACIVNGRHPRNWRRLVLSKQLMLTNDNKYKGIYVDIDDHWIKIGDK